jgi:tRNA nucleotidyltransferase (CCA-adding enzyme)
MRGAAQRCCLSSIVCSGCRSAPNTTRRSIPVSISCMPRLGCAARCMRLPVRFALLLHDLGKGTTPREEWPRHIAHEARSASWSMPYANASRCHRIVATWRCLAARYHGDIHRAAELRADTIVRLFEKSDALRRPQRFEQLLEACAADFNGRLGWEEKPYAASDRLRAALAAVQAVPAGEIAQSCANPAQIPECIHAARVAAVATAIRSDD